MMTHLINQSEIVQYKNPMCIPNNRGYPPICAKCSMFILLVFELPELECITPAVSSVLLHRRWADNLARVHISNLP